MGPEGRGPGTKASPRHAKVWALMILLVGSETDDHVFFEVKLIVLEGSCMATPHIRGAHDLVDGPSEWDLIKNDS